MPTDTKWPPQDRVSPQLPAHPWQLSPPLATVTGAVLASGGRVGVSRVTGMGDRGTGAIPGAATPGSCFPGSGRGQLRGPSPADACET